MMKIKICLKIKSVIITDAPATRDDDNVFFVNMAL